MNYLDLKNDAFGLDITDSSVKIVKLGRGKKGLSIDSIGKAPLENGTVELGIIKNEKALAVGIKNAYEKARGKRIKSKQAVVSLPEKESFLVVIQMPKMNQEELRRAILFEAENYIPLPIKSVYMDFQIISSHLPELDHLDVLCVATPKKIVDSYVAAIKLAGLTPIAMELQSQALARALIKDESTDYPVLLINTDKRKIDFIFFSGNSIRFTNSIPFKKDFLSETKKMISYYQEHSLHEHVSSGTKIRKIIFCSDFDEIGLGEKLFQNQTGITAQMADPFANLGKIKIKENKPENFLQFSTALGLAERGVNYD